MSLASRHLGWKAAWLSEIEAFPSAVLAHHWPDVPNVGDMRAIPAQIRSREMEAPPFFTGGTPCQAFSVAGNRDSLSDDRGALSLTFCEIADAIDDVRHADGDEPCIVQWENVPGCLSTDDNAFGCFLAGLAGERDPIEPGPRPKPGRSSTHWRWKKDTGVHVPCWPVAGVVAGPRRTVAWRVLDAQYFNLAQRRERVFVVASARNGFSPARILFESEGVRRDTAPSRQEGQDVAGTIAGGARQHGGYSTDDIPLTAGTLRAAGGGSDVDHARAGHLVASASPVICMAHGQGGAEVLQDHCPTLTCNHEAPIAAYEGVTHTLRADGFDASEDGTGRGTPLIPVMVPVSVALRGREGGSAAEIGDDLAFTLRASSGGGDKAHVLAPIAFSCKDHGGDAGDVAPTLRAMGHSGSHANAGGQVAVSYRVAGDGAAYVEGDCTAPLTTGTDRSAQCVSAGMAVRRLTPRECERLQGMPDDHTLIPIKKGKPKPVSKIPSAMGIYDSILLALADTRGAVTKELRFAVKCSDGKAQVYAMAADGPRYKAIGNSWAVLCVSWILDRVQREVDMLDARRDAA